MGKLDKIKTFQNKQKLKEFIITGIAPRGMPKGVLQVKMKGH